MLILITIISVSFMIVSLIIGLILDYIKNKRTPFDLLYRLYEFLFDRWTWSIIDKGTDTFFYSDKYGREIPNSRFTKEWYLYKLVNKFDGSIKYKKRNI